MRVGMAGRPCGRMGVAATRLYGPLRIRCLAGDRGASHVALTRNSVTRRQFTLRKRRVNCRIIRNFRVICCCGRVREACVAPVMYGRYGRGDVALSACLRFRDSPYMRVVATFIRSSLPCGRC
jgi:hypothetical protein